MFMHAKLCVCKIVTVWANLHGLIYNVLIDIVLPVFFWLNISGLVALTEYQQMG